MKVFPVIHTHLPLDVVATVRTAVDCGADGVFLIDHDSDDARLGRQVTALRDSFPTLFLGVNIIRRGLVDSLRVLGQWGRGVDVVDALWVDSAGLNRAGDEDPLVRAAAEKQAVVDYDARTRAGWTGTYFGGVAFKYQDPVPQDELDRVGRTARRWIDVPTTSGPGTGQSADLARLAALRRGLGPDHPLALASGVTPENVGDFRPYVDRVLVSTGIQDEAGGIDPTKLTRLVAAARPDD